jgi:hypothetical protein
MDREISLEKIRPNSRRTQELQIMCSERACFSEFLRDNMRFWDQNPSKPI